MCVILAKYFNGIGWAGAKNRDRNYTPVLDFVEDNSSFLVQVAGRLSVEG